VCTQKIRFFVNLSRPSIVAFLKHLYLLRCLRYLHQVRSRKRACVCNVLSTFDILFPVSLWMTKSEKRYFVDFSVVPIKSWIGRKNKHLSRVVYLKSLNCENAVFENILFKATSLTHPPTLNSPEKCKVMLGLLFTPCFLGSCNFFLVWFLKVSQSV
jgi:hypothetical protein